MHTTPSLQGEKSKERLYLKKWEQETKAGDKTCTRRLFVEATHTRFERIAQQAGWVRAGGRSHASQFVWCRLTAVFYETLGNMVDSDVICEGGGENTTAREFIRQNPDLRTLKLDTLITVIRWDEFTLV